MLVIAAKDLRQRSRDRSAYVMGIVGPLALVVILNGTLGSVEESTGFEFGVVNADGGEVAAEFVSALDAIEEDGIVEVTNLEDRAGLEQAVDDGDLRAGFVIPSGFSQQARSGDATEIIVVGDPGSAITVDVAEAIAATFASEIDYVTVAIASVAATGQPVDNIDELAAAAQTIERPVQIAAVEGSGRGSDPGSYFAVSLSVFFLFFTVQFGVLSLLEEREMGTLNRLLVAPLSTGTVLVAKLLSSLVIGAATMVVLVAATTVIVDATWGNLIGVSVLVLFGILTAMALATLVGAMARTTEQAGAYASIAAVVLGLLGGTFFPIDTAPGFLTVVSYASPHRWLLEGFRDLSYGAGVADLAPSLTILSGFIMVVGGAGLFMARRGLDPS
ncbi:MAG: ABC transporter permease [Actinomycetia bacterium]|nr:ABC transporter permease [Actinomycetes bacterium]